MTAKIVEHPFEFACVDRPSIGIVSVPEDVAPEIGVLIVVGGPQYRVGAHRRFVQLARHLASQGIAAMRFDVRGMGDCVGDHPGFENLNDDIRSAVDAFRHKLPGLKRVVLWGLCDGASAACLYASQDPRIAGLVLLNPWVKNPTGGAEPPLKQYYARRLLTRVFWRRFFAGDLAIGQKLSQLFKRRGAAPSGTGPAQPMAAPSAVVDSSIPANALSTQMALSLLNSTVPFYVTLSEIDLVARQFEYDALPRPEWDAAMRLQGLDLVHLPAADHTLSTPTAMHAMAEMTTRWVQEIGAGRHRRRLLLPFPRMRSRRLYAKVIFGVVIGLIALDM